MIGREARVLHLSLGLDAERARVLSAGVLDRSPGGRGGGNRMRTFIAPGGDGEGELFARLWAALRAMPSTPVVMWSRAQLDALRAMRSRHEQVCGGPEMMRRLGSGRLVLLDEDLIRSVAHGPMTAGTTFAFAWTIGAGVEDGDDSPTELARLHSAAFGTPASLARSGRLALARMHRRLCLASLVIVNFFSRPLLDDEDPDEDAHDGASAVDDRVDATEPAEGDDDDSGGDQDRAIHFSPDWDEDQTPEPLPAVVAPAPPPDRPMPQPSGYEPPLLVVARAGLDLPPMHEDLERFRVLERPLPLVGAAAYAATPSGVFALADRLRAASPWMGEAIAAIERSLRIGWWSGRPWLAWRPLLLVGDPGAGKSHFARELAAASGVPISQMDLGSASDALSVAGVTRGWASTTPCWPARAITEHRVANPIMLGDELDKAGGTRSSGGAVHEALLAMLEPSTARAFSDRCLHAQLDLSACVWIFTANDASALPRPLLSRLDVVEVGRPGPEHFDLLRAGIEGGLAVRWGVPAAMMPDLPPRAVATLRAAFSRHRSARRLQADVARLLATVVPDRPGVPH